MFSAPVRYLAWVTASLAVLATALSFNTSRNATAAVPATTAPASAEKSPEDNPRVAPGLVNWHANVADAKAAAVRSGRPVLVFHMMGQLDRQFC